MKFKKGKSKVLKLGVGWGGANGTWQYMPWAKQLESGSSVEDLGILVYETIASRSGYKILPLSTGETHLVAGSNSGLSRT